MAPLGPVERSHPARVTRTSGSGGSSTYRSPFNLSPLWLSLPFFHVTPFAILRRPSRYSSSTTVCRSSLQSVMQPPLARIVLASFAPRFAPGPRRPWIAEPTWAILQQLLEARRTRFATVRRCRRSLLRLVFSAWHRHRQDHRLRACDYHQQCALFDYRVAFAMWNERYFGAFARRACRTDYQAWLLAQTEKISSAAESGDLGPFWSLVRALKRQEKTTGPSACRG